MWFFFFPQSKPSSTLWLISSLIFGQLLRNVKLKTWNIWVVAVSVPGDSFHLTCWLDIFLCIPVSYCINWGCWSDRIWVKNHQILPFCSSLMCIYVAIFSKCKALNHTFSSKSLKNILSLNLALSRVAGPHLVPIILFFFFWIVCKFNLNTLSSHIEQSRKY